MKIAIVSDDKTTINQHFGRALFYSIANVKDEEIEYEKPRSKVVHHNAAEQKSHGLANDCHHDYSADASAKHKGMIGTISDCQVIIAGGMGWSAYESFKNQNIEVVVTDVKNIDEAVRLYSAGNLPDLFKGCIHHS